MKKLLLLFIPFLLLAGGIGGYIFWYNLPFQQIERALQEEDYETVAELYGELSREEDRETVQETLSAVAEEYYEEYRKEKISFEEADGYFDLVWKVLKDKREVVVQRENMEEIRESRITFEQGEELMEQGEYLEAIVCFREISALDRKYRKKAEEWIPVCRNGYCEEVLGRVQEMLEAKAFEDAHQLVGEALEHFPEEVSLTQKQQEIEELEKQERERLERERLEREQLLLVGNWSMEYDLGELIAEELGVKGYLLYFPVKMIVTIDEDSLQMYVQKDSIKPALDALTADPASMSAIYQVAQNYGINKSTADFLIRMTYGGSYSDFILDNFGDEIDAALAEFSLSTIYYADGTRIYLGTAQENETHYLSYVCSLEELQLEGYVGGQMPLSLLELKEPLCLKPVSGAG